MEEGEESESEGTRYWSRYECISGRLLDEGLKSAEQLLALDF